MDVSLRSYRPLDFEYARGLYFETMRWAIERVFGWDQTRQESSFAEWFKPNEVQIVVVDGVDAGWIQWRANDQAVSLGSIYIAPGMQRKGIGTRVIRMISECATQRSQPMILAVMKINPALAFYERLGFRVTHEDDYKFYLRSGSSAI